MKKLYVSLALMASALVAGCSGVTNSLAQLTPEQVATVTASDRPFASAVGILGEIDACAGIVEVMTGVPVDMQTPENSASSISACNTVISLGAMFIPVNSTISPTGESLTPREVACRDSFVSTAGTQDPAFQAMIDASCKA